MTFWVSMVQGLCLILFTIDTAITPEGWKIFSLIMNWLWIPATFVLMYLFEGQFNLWHDLMSKKVGDEFIRRWDRDYPNGALPQLNDDPFSGLATDEAVEKRPGKKISQEDYLDQKNREDEKNNVNPSADPEPNNNFGDKTADAFDAVDSFDFVF